MLFFTVFVGLMNLTVAQYSYKQMIELDRGNLQAGLLALVNLAFATLMFTKALGQLS